MAGTSDSKGKRDTSIDPLTAKDLSELQVDIDASDLAMSKIMSTIRQRIGLKVHCMRVMN